MSKKKMSEMNDEELGEFFHKVLNKEVIKPYNLTLDENVIKILKEKGYNISKLVRTLLKKKLEQERKQ